MNFSAGSIIAVQERSDRKQPSRNPAFSRTIFLFEVHEFSREANNIFFSWQVLNKLISQQRVTLFGLFSAYCRITDMIEPLIDGRLVQIDTLNFGIYDHLAIAYSNA